VEKACSIFVVFVWTSMKNYDHLRQLSEVVKRNIKGHNNLSIVQHELKNKPKRFTKDGTE
jgi:hypothetical protein